MFAPDTMTLNRRGCHLLILHPPPPSLLLRSPFWPRHRVSARLALLCTCRSFDEQEATRLAMADSQYQGLTDSLAGERARRGSPRRVSIIAVPRPGWPYPTA
eukprot:4068492-Pyramimonas_sp.AAC.1